MNDRPQTVLTDAAPAPAGHYSQAIRSGNNLYISGQLPIRADKMPLPDGKFETQARQAIANMLAILEAVGATCKDLCKLTAYIVGVENWPEFNRICADMLGSAKPARTVVPVPELHYAYLVEVDAIANIPDFPQDAQG